MEHLKSGLNAVVLTLSRSPSNARERLEELRWFDAQRPIVIDGYSCLLGGDAKPDGYTLPNLSDLSEISIMVSKLISAAGEGSLFVFDHISALLIYNEEIKVVKLVQTLVARIREARDLAIIVFENSIHTQSFYNTVRFFVDCVMDFKVEEMEGSLFKTVRVNRARFPVSDSQWHPIDIDGNGKIMILPSVSWKDYRNLESVQLRSLKAR